MYKAVSGEIGRGQGNAAERFYRVDVYLDEYDIFFGGSSVMGRRVENVNCLLSNIPGL